LILGRLWGSRPGGLTLPTTVKKHPITPNSTQSRVSGICSISQVFAAIRGSAGSDSKSRAPQGAWGFDPPFGTIRINHLRTRPLKGKLTKIWDG
jgi:hypothetical protein